MAHVEVPGDINKDLELKTVIIDTYDTSCPVEVVASSRDVP